MSRRRATRASTTSGPFPARSTSGPAGPKPRAASPVSPSFHALQLQDFLQAILEDRAPAVTGAEARKSLEIILAVYHSSRTGQPVKLPLATDPAVVKSPLTPRPPSPAAARQGEGGRSVLSGIPVLI